MDICIRRSCSSHTSRQSQLTSAELHLEVPLHQLLWDFKAPCFVAIPAAELGPPARPVAALACIPRFPAAASGRRILHVGAQGNPNSREYLPRCWIDPKY